MCVKSDTGKIEITPEMIEAGLIVFIEYDPNWGPDARETVGEIYRVMTEAKSISPNGNGEPS